MQVTRFSAGPDGRSTFSTVDIAYPRQRDDAFGHTISATDAFTSPAAQLIVLPAGLDQGWHPAPRRQFVTVLTGQVEVGTPDGATRRFGPGQMFLADDVGTEGHTTRTVDGPVHALVTPLPEDAVVWT
jgi:quercetin dioxygenase-like cupin family protein